MAGSCEHGNEPWGCLRLENFLTYILTPWSRDLLKKLTATQLVK